MQRFLDHAGEVIQEKRFCDRSENLERCRLFLGFLDQAYTVTSEVVSLGESPKTEILWFDSEASDADGRTVATMRMQLRFMKASSELYSG